MMEEGAIADERKSPNVNTSDLRFSLLHSPPVIESILKFLPCEDLSSCSKVCSSWKKIASAIEKKRNHIYIVLKFDVHLCATIPDAWRDASLAICCGATGNRLDFTSNISVYIRYIEQRNSDYQLAEEIHLRLIRQIRREDEKLKKLLPKIRTLLHVAPALFSSLSLGNWCYEVVQPPTMILIPSIEGIQVHPFAIPDDLINNIAYRSDYKDLFLSGEEASFSSPIKCVVTFADANLRHRICDSNVLQSYSSEETVTIECLHPYFVATGIAFSGRGIQVKCVTIKENRCCTTHCFSVLRELQFNDKCGIAFITQGNNSWPEYLAINMWPTFFSNIHLVCFAKKIRYMSSTNATVCSLQQCKECGADQNQTTTDESIVIVFIFLNAFVVECIHK